jgi:hypothetical protein
MKYGENGKEYNIGGTPLKVDDEFILATLLAIVGLMQQIIPKFDDMASATASKIYDEIQKNKSTT